MVDVDVTPILPLSDTVGVYFFYCFGLDSSKLAAPIPEVMRTLVAEGIDGFIGYPGQIPLHRYPVILEHNTFGQSGLPFTLKGARKIDYGSNLCPEAERACRETVCMRWTDRMEDSHLRQIAAAVRKVVSAYSVSLARWAE